MHLMPSFKLVSTTEDGVITTKEFSSDFLPTVLNSVSDFLKGSGFDFYDIEVVEEPIYDTSN